MFQFSYMEFLMRPREGSTTMHKERLWIGMREFGECTWLTVDDLEEEIKGERCKAMRLHILIVSLESLSLTLTQFFYVVSGSFFQWYISSKIYRSMYCTRHIELLNRYCFWVPLLKFFGCLKRVNIYTAVMEILRYATCHSMPWVSYLLSSFGSLMF